MRLLWRDVRFAARSLGRDLRFTGLAVLALALGIGATTAIFSVIDNVLLDPFPYKDSRRMVQFEIHDSSRSGPGGRGGLLIPEFLDYQAQNRVFDRMIASNNLDVLYTNGDGTERFNGQECGPGTFEFLGMAPLLGRSFGPDDYRSDAPLCSCCVIKSGSRASMPTREFSSHLRSQRHAAHAGRHHASALWMGRCRSVGPRTDDPCDRCSCRWTFHKLLLDARLI